MYPETFAIKKKKKSLYAFRFVNPQFQHFPDKYNAHILTCILAALHVPVFFRIIFLTHNRGGALMILYIEKIGEKSQFGKKSAKVFQLLLVQ